MTKPERRAKRQADIQARRKRKSDVIFERFLNELWPWVQNGKLKIGGTGND